MKITFLGTSHGIAEKDKFLSSTVITINGKHYIIDAGAPITSLLQNHGIKFTDINGIFITHPHFDHFIGLAEFTCQMNGFNQFADVNIPVYIPDPVPFKRMLYFLSGQDTLTPNFGFDEKYNNGNYGSEDFPSRLKFKVFKDGIVFEDENIKITAVKNMHIENSYSFIIETEGKIAVFTGDLKHGIPDYPSILLKSLTPIEFVVLEGAHTKLCDQNVLNILKNSKVKNMIINHRFGGCNSDDELIITKNALSPYFNFFEAHDNDVLEF